MPSHCPARCHAFPHTGDRRPEHFKHQPSPACSCALVSSQVAMTVLEPMPCPTPSFVWQDLPVLHKSLKQLSCRAWLMKSSQLLHCVVPGRCSGRSGHVPDVPDVPDIPDTLSFRTVFPVVPGHCSGRSGRSIQIYIAKLTLAPFTDSYMYGKSGLGFLNLYGKREPGYLNLYGKSEIGYLNLYGKSETGYLNLYGKSELGCFNLYGKREPG